MSQYVRKTPPKNYITLIEGGYWARFTAIKGGKLVNIKHKTFYFSKYDHDPLAAKAAAESWVKYWAPRLKKPLKTEYRQLRFHKKSRHGRKGPVGVCHNVYSSGTPYYDVFWSESFIENGKRVRKQRRRAFSYDGTTEGKKLAFERACAHRQAMERKHYDCGIDT